MLTVLLSEPSSRSLCIMSRPSTSTSRTPDKRMEPSALSRIAIDFEGVEGCRRSLISSL